MLKALDNYDPNILSFSFSSLLDSEGVNHHGQCARSEYLRSSGYSLFPVFQTVYPTLL